MQYLYYVALKIFVGTITIDLDLLIYLILSAKGPIMALDFPKPVPSSISVILWGHYNSKLKTMICSALKVIFS
jgi:hypothetical protein